MILVVLDYVQVVDMKVVIYGSLYPILPRTPAATTDAKYYCIYAAASHLLLLAER